MHRRVQVAGQTLTETHDVLDTYVPAPQWIPAPRWSRIRPEVVRAVGASHHSTPGAALIAIRYTARLVSWAIDQDMPLNATTILKPENIEHFVGSQLTGFSASSISSVRSHLRRVAKSIAGNWPHAPRPYARPSTLSPPYSLDEVQEYWETARAQATEYRRRVMTATLALGLGAGLRASEVAAVTSVDHVRQHPVHDRLWAIVLPDRTVPVLHEYVPALKDLCRRYPFGTLIGAVSKRSNDPLGPLLSHIEFPERLPALTCYRLRSTWMTTVLTRDLRISEFMAIAGTVSAKTLEGIAAHVPARKFGDEYLIKGAGLNAPP